MKQVLYIVGILALAALAAGATYYYQQQRVDNMAAEREALTRNLEAVSDDEDTTGQTDEADMTSYVSEKGVSVTVTTPLQRTRVASPLEVNGSVPGNWSHEGQFSVRLLDANNFVVSEGEATIEGDWMTEEPVSFSATLTYEESQSGAGMLQLVKANPSGLEENDDTVYIPVSL